MRLQIGTQRPASNPKLLPHPPPLPPLVIPKRVPHHTPEICLTQRLTARGGRSDFR